MKSQYTIRNHWRLKIQSVASVLGFCFMLLPFAFIGCHKSAIENQESAIENQESAIENQESAIENQESAIGNQERAVGSSELSNTQSQPATPILNTADHQKILDDIEQIKDAWLADDDEKVKQVCGVPRLGSNLHSKGFVARQAQASTCEPLVLLEYNIARVPVAMSENSIVYGNLIQMSGDWVFLNFARDPVFAFNGFGSIVPPESDQSNALIDAIDLAIERFRSGQDPVNQETVKLVPFLATTHQLTQPNVGELDSAILDWQKQPNEIRISKLAFVEVALGDEATYSDPYFPDHSPNQTVVLVFEEWGGKLCCTEGMRELRLALKPSDARLLANSVPGCDVQTTQVIETLFSGGDLNGLEELVAGFSDEQFKAIMPYAMAAYQRRKYVYKDKTRLGISRMLAEIGNESKSALPLLVEEIRPSVLAESKTFVDETIVAISRIVGDSELLQRLRKTRNVAAWNSLVNVLERADDVDKLVEFLQTEDLQSLRTQLDEMLEEGGLGLRKVEQALEFFEQ